MTPEVYLYLKPSESATEATRKGSPRKTSMAGRVRPFQSLAPVRYLATPRPEPWPCPRPAVNLMCIPDLILAIVYPGVRMGETNGIGKIQQLLDGTEMRNHLYGIRCGLVSVGPPCNLVEVFADSG